MSKIGSYFSFQGRANRQRYWLTGLALFGIMLAGSFVSYALGVAGVVVGGVVFLGAMVAGLATAVRRIHDRGRSGWWLLLMYLPVVLLSALGAVARMSDPDAGALFSVLSLPFSIWAFVELGCLPGTAGPNRFGADPLEPSPAVVFS